MPRALEAAVAHLAAHPELHPRSPDRDSDRRFLAAKLADADFALTQFFFTVDDYERLYATIILNNRDAYTASEVAAASAYLAERRPAALLRASKQIFLQRYPVLATHGE